MNKNDLYSLDIEVHKKVDIIKNEQAEYVRGVEKGIDLMVDAVRAYLREEDENATKDEKRKKDCSNCDHKNKGNGACNVCVNSYNPVTGERGTPSHWRAKAEAHPTEKGGE